MIENLSVGNVIAIAACISSAVIAAWRWFDKAYTLRHQTEDLINKVNNNDREISDIKNRLIKIIDMLEKQNDKTKEVTICTLRNSIWDMHKRCVNEGYVTKEDLKTLCELVRVYENAGGNDIVHSKLYPEIKKLEVRD